MPVLNAQRLEKSFGERPLFRDATLTLVSGERVGLVGRNGTGKSTLARVLAGLEPPDAGELMLRRGAEVRYLAQAPSFDPALTPREIVTEGLATWARAKARYDELGELLAKDASPELLAEHAELGHEIEHHGGWQRDHEVDAMLMHLGIARRDQPIGSMSGGEKRRVALAQILIARPALAILDEPTNHLDVETIDWLERYLLEEHPGAVLLVTHDRYLLDRVCTRTLELERGTLQSYDGGYEEYLEAKATRLAHEERTEANRQNFLRRELEWLSRQPKARTTKQKARIERAEAARAIQAPVAEERVALSLEEARSGKTVLELEHLSLEIAGRTLVRDLTLYLPQGERVGIVGANGTGKTTLLRAIAGELAPSSGRLTLGQNTKLAYFDQERSGLDLDKSIFDNIGDQGRFELDGQVLDTRSYLERFLFDSHEQRKRVAALSGGERARVALAKVLRAATNLVLLDEPTNDLDVATLGALEEMLLGFGGAALVVTHDRWFLDRVATSLLVFEGDGRVVRYPGNYETYRRLKGAAQSAPPPAEPEKKAAARPSQKPDKPKGLTYAERLELEKLPERIETADALVRSLEERIADPAFFRSEPDQVKRTLGELDAAKVEASALMARWEELETKAL
ncbi:MAG: ABC-F family ATP-binding cassette domain-containing protein [Polyangiaceae bacterium]|nr:ABC-F family ATP-binding cassette domain-containing protein [Polyangiaceae bacterium]MCE7890707.1 ABC transporter ATP-binding protein [Sorangiineae bacterium PRO1]